MVKRLIEFARHKESLAVGLSFMIFSIIFGSWATRIPDVQNQLQLSEGPLGRALLGFSIGALILLPFSSWFMARFTTGKVVFYSAILFCLAFMLPVAAPTYILLILACLIAGAVNGVMDVAVNAAATAVEEKNNIVIMSTCHGMFSLGIMIGGILGSLIAGWGISPLLHMVGMGILMTIAALFLKNTWLDLPESEVEEGTIFVLPSGNLLILGIIGFSIMLGEGAIIDWSAVYLKNTLGGSAYLAGLGFAGFSLAMAIGRFYGDGIIPKYGSKAIVQWGSLLGALGLLIAVLVPYIPIVIIGFTIAGLGFSCVVPILFSAAARVPGVASGTGIAAVTTSGIMGFLLGPPLIGFIADEINLAVGLGFVVGLTLLSFLLAGMVKWKT